MNVIFYSINARSALSTVEHYHSKPQHTFHKFYKDTKTYQKGLIYSCAIT